MHFIDYTRSIFLVVAAEHDFDDASIVRGIHFLYPSIRRYICLYGYILNEKKLCQIENHHKKY